MRLVSPLLVVSALADTTLLTGFLKGLAAAGFPATASDLGLLLASLLVGLYTRWQAARKLDRKVEEKLAKALPQAVAAHLSKSRAKRKKANV